MSYYTIIANGASVTIDKDNIQAGDLLRLLYFLSQHSGSVFTVSRSLR